MKKENLAAIIIASIVIVCFGLANRPSGSYKDAEDLAEKANKLRQSNEYLSYNATLSLFGMEGSAIKVYSKGGRYYRFETPGNVALSKTSKMLDTDTNEVEDFDSENSMYNIIKITNITSNKYFHNKYATLGKADKVGNYECTHVKFDPRSPEYDLCIDDKYGLPIKTDVKMKGMTVITLTLSDISDEKFDETLLSEF